MLNNPTKNIYPSSLQAQLDEFELMREEYKEKREDSISLDDDVASDDDN